MIYFKEACQWRVSFFMLIYNAFSCLHCMENDFMTPLHRAAMEGDADNVIALIKKSADVNAQNHVKMTPLHFAALFNHPEIIQLLLDNGANINHESYCFFDTTTLARGKIRPLNTAIMAQSMDAVWSLLQNGAADNVIAITQLDGLPKLQSVKSHEKDISMLLALLKKDDTQLTQLLNDKPDYPLLYKVLLAAIGQRNLPMTKFLLGMLIEKGWLHDTKKILSFIETLKYGRSYIWEEERKVYQKIIDCINNADQQLQRKLELDGEVSSHHYWQLLPIELFLPLLAYSVSHQLQEQQTV